MNTAVSPFFTFNTHCEAEDAIAVLGRAGLNVKNMSLIGKGYRDAWDIKGGRDLNAFWGLLQPAAVLFLPGIGLVGLAGPVATALRRAREGSLQGYGIPTLGAALFRSGMSKDRIPQVKRALKADRYVLLVHGTAEEIAKAQPVLTGALGLLAA